MISWYSLMWRSLNRHQYRAWRPSHLNQQEAVLLEIAWVSCLLPQALEADLALPFRPGAYGRQLCSRRNLHSLDTASAWGRAGSLPETGFLRRSHLDAEFWMFVGHTATWEGSEPEGAGGHARKGTVWYEEQRWIVAQRDWQHRVSSPGFGEVDEKWQKKGCEHI